MCLTPHMEEKSGENHIYFPNVVYVVARVLGLSLDCGGEVENTGGAITMMNMVRGPKFKYYDCVWLIKPISNYVSQEFLLYMAIITFSNMGKWSLSNHRYIGAHCVAKVSSISKFFEVFDLFIFFRYQFRNKCLRGTDFWGKSSGYNKTFLSHTKAPVRCLSPLWFLHFIEGHI